MRFQLLLTSLMAVAVSAQAGVVIVEKSEPLQGGGAASLSKIMVDPQHIRVESSGGEQQHVFIYRADRQTMYMVDSQNKTYREMTRQELEQMTSQAGAKMAEMQKMMEERLKNMPPQQRQMVEQMMKGKMGASPAAAAAKTTYRKVASGERVGQWTCDKYQGDRDNQKVSEVWTTDFKTFGLTADDFRILQDLAAFFKSLSSRFGADYFQVGAQGPATESEFSGVPVRRMTYRDGKPVRKHEVTEVTRQDFNASVFEVPQGFRKLDTFR